MFSALNRFLKPSAWTSAPWLIDIGKFGRRARVIADVDGIVQSRRSRNALRRCGRDSLQRRFRRHLRKTAGSVEVRPSRKFRPGGRARMSLRKPRSLPASLWVAITSILCHSAFAADRIHYTVTLGNPETHFVQVTIDVPPGQSDANYSCRCGTRSIRCVISRSI